MDMDMDMDMDCFLNKVKDPIIIKLMDKLEEIENVNIDDATKDSEIKKIQTILKIEYKRLFESLLEKPFMKLIMEFVDFNKMLDNGYPFNYKSYFKDNGYYEINDEIFDELYNLNISKYELITDLDIIQLIESNSKNDDVKYLDKKFIIDNKYILISYVLTEYANGLSKYQDFELINLDNLKNNLI